MMASPFGPILQEMFLRGSTPLRKTQMDSGARVRIDEVATIVTGSTPTSKASDNWGNGTAFLTPSDIASIDYHPRVSRRLSEAGEHRVKTRVIDVPAVAVVCIGATIGKIALISERTVTNQQINTVVPDRTRLDAHYCYYALQQCQATMKAIASGSATPILNKSTFSQLEIPLPPLNEQRRIAGVLGALDDLIEVDRQILRDSFEVALAAFHQKSEGAADFLSLAELYEVGLSGVWGKDSPEGRASEQVVVLRGRDLEDLWSVNIASPPTRYLSEQQVSNRSPGFGEIWTAGSGSLGPSLPVIDGFRQLFGATEVLYSNFVKRLVPIQDPTWFGPSWLAMVSAWQAGAFENFRTGTAMPNLDADALLRGVQVPLLDPEERRSINGLVESALKPDLREEITDLASTRDELLPLLMSGRVRVGDVAA